MPNEEVIKGKPNPVVKKVTTKPVLTQAQKQMSQKKQLPILKKTTPKKTPTKAQNPATKNPNDTGADRTQKHSHKVKYKYTGRESLLEALRRVIPKKLIPSDRLSTIFGGVFLAVILLALVTFPYGSLLSGNVDMTVRIGVPFTFLELGIIEEGELPIDIINLLLDLIIYLFVAYLIDILVNQILRSTFMRPKDEKKKKPVVFRDKKQSKADKITKKVFEEPPPAIAKKASETPIKKQQSNNLSLKTSPTPSPVKQNTPKIPTKTKL